MNTVSRVKPYLVQPFIRSGLSKYSPPKMSFPSDSVHFSGNIPSKAEKEFMQVEQDFYRLINDKNVSEEVRQKALQKYEKTKKEAGDAKAIKDTVTWLVTGAGATAAALTVIEPTTASKIGALISFVGAPLGTLAANSVHRGKDGKNFWDKLDEGMLRLGEFEQQIGPHPW